MNFRFMLDNSKIEYIRGPLKIKNNHYFVLFNYCSCFFHLWKEGKKTQAWVQSFLCYQFCSNPRRIKRMCRAFFIHDVRDKTDQLNQRNER